MEENNSFLLDVSIPFRTHNNIVQFSCSPSIDSRTDYSGSALLDPVKCLKSVVSTEIWIEMFP